jgi:hypothetical protein
MLNSRPNNKNYNQGNYVPKNKDKVLKLNAQGGIFYRSGWEKKIITWLDNNVKIVKWGSECLRIPYQMTHVVNGDVRIKEHSYFPDFYYEIQLSDGSIKHVVAEVKPKADYNDAIMFTEGKFQTPEKTSLKKLQSLEYKFKMAQKNAEKWQTMIKWCEKKGYDFIIITEDHLKKFNL